MESDMKRVMDNQTEVKKLKAKSIMSNSDFAIPPMHIKRSASSQLIAIEGNLDDASHAEMSPLKQSKQLMLHLSSPNSPESAETSVNSDVSKLSALSVATRLSNKRKHKKDDHIIHIKHMPQNDVFHKPPGPLYEEEVAMSETTSIRRQRTLSDGEWNAQINALKQQFMNMQQRPLSANFANNVGSAPNSFNFGDELQDQFAVLPMTMPNNVLFNQMMNAYNNHAMVFGNMLTAEDDDVSNLDDNVSMLSGNSSPKKRQNTGRSSDDNDSTNEDNISMLSGVSSLRTSPKKRHRFSADKELSQVSEESEGSDDTERDSEHSDDSKTEITETKESEDSDKQPSHFRMPSVMTDTVPSDNDNAPTVEVMNQIKEEEDESSSESASDQTDDRRSSDSVTSTVDSQFDDEKTTGDEEEDLDGEPYEFSSDIEEDEDNDDEIMSDGKFDQMFGLGVSEIRKSFEAPNNNSNDEPYPD